MEREVDDKEDIKVGIRDLLPKSVLCRLHNAMPCTLPLRLQQTDHHGNYTRVQSVKRKHQDAFFGTLQLPPGCTHSRHKDISIPTYV